MPGARGDGVQQAQEGARVLVIDDDPDLRPLVERALGAVGLTVVFSTDPTKAVALAREHAPALVLCDITMPVMDGYSVLRALQADALTARCPVVFLTASRQPLDRVRAFRFGVVGYLTKPIEAEQLGRDVTTLLAELPTRSGAVRGAGSQVLEELRRDARNGLLRVQTPRGEARAVAVLGGRPTETPRDPDSAEFRELDPAREEIVLPDAGTSEAHVPGFEDVPEALRSVLLLESDLNFRRLLGRALAAHGLTVYAAGDVTTGLRLAIAHRPGLLVVDVRLPDAGAFDFCREARAHSLLHKLPLVVLAGFDDFSARLQGFSAGAEDYVAREAPLREILFRLQLVLRRRLPSRGAANEVLAGDLEALGAPGALQMAHLARLSGVLRAQSAGRQAEVGFHQGEIVTARLGDLTDEAALFDFIGWEQGAFSFVPGQAPQVERLGLGFEQLLLEGCRRLDEGRATGDASRRARST